MPYTLPLAAISSSRIASFHRPRSSKSQIKCLLMTKNSPAITRLTYKLLVNGSNDSLLPKIYAVDAVGISAMSKELRSPLATILSLSPFQSYFPDKTLAPSFHMSNYKMPLDAGDPSNEAYGPSRSASAQDSLSAL